MTALNTIGQRLKFALSQNGMYQYELAELLETDPSTVNGWVKDKHLPEPYRYPQFAQHLNADSAWFLEGKGDPPTKIEKRAKSTRRIRLVHVSRGTHANEMKKPTLEESERTMAIVDEMGRTYRERRDAGASPTELARIRDGMVLLVRDNIRPNMTEQGWSEADIARAVEGIVNRRTIDPDELPQAEPKAANGHQH